MPIPLNFTWNTGKAAMMGSLAEYFTTQIPDESFEFDTPLLPVRLPGIGVTERGLYNLAPVAFEHFVGYRDGKPLYARKNQTLVEISAWDDETQHSNAVGKVRQMRDKLIYLLYNAGRTDDADVLILPPIYLYDYTQIPKKQMGVIEVDNNDNAINERFLVDPINSNIKRYVILARIFWYEHLSP